MKKLNLNAIRIDGGTQSRVEINNEIVSDYADAIRSGRVDFPPVVVFHDGADHWLGDGFHRLHAHRQAEKASIAADIRAGTVRDAILFSLGANAAHGLHRSNADKRKAVGAMLADEEWAAWSDRKIAEACGVSQPFVSGMRKPKEVITVITPPAAAKPEKAPKRTLTPPPPADAEDRGADDLAEAQHTVAELAQENEQLRDRLAVESLLEPEDAKTQTAETIRDLRERVRLLEIEVDALKASRDTYMRESSEKTAQINYWRKEAKKAGAEA